MSGRPLVLAVDDEPSILRLIAMELESQGFRVMTAARGDEAISMTQSENPDIILLDILMPETDGLEVMNTIRAISDTPVIFVTAKDNRADKIHGLDLGADDYIVKPFSPEELAARIRAVLRRRAGREEVRPVIRTGKLTIDLSRGVATVDGDKRLSLTRTEWLVLQHLAANVGRVVLNSELLTKVWGPEYREELQYLRVWISRLRRKIEDNPARPRIIKTLHGIGYILEGEPKDARTLDGGSPVAPLISPRSSR